MDAATVSPGAATKGRPPRTFPTFAPAAPFRRLAQSHDRSTLAPEHLDNHEAVPYKAVHDE
ncbi:MAG TPA: hypothetical protein VF656_19380 [Pyrinomonadaceae bacterium]